MSAMNDYSRMPEIEAANLPQYLVGLNIRPIIYFAYTQVHQLKISDTLIGIVTTLKNKKKY